MEKRISYDQFQSVKRVAQACNPLMVKREKIRAKIESLTKEYEDYDTQIASLEAGIKQVIGFRVEELVKKVIEPGIDGNGQPKKTTKYLPTNIVSYDEDKKQFVITMPDEEPEEETPSDTVVSEPAAPVKVPSEETTPTEEEEENATPSEEETPSFPEDAPIFE